MVLVTMRAKALSRRRLWMTLLALCSLGAAALTFAFWAVVETEWGRRRTERLVVSAIEDELGLEAQFSDLRIAGIPPVVTARGVALTRPGTKSFAQASGVSLRPSLLSLLRGHVSLGDIELHGPKLHLVFEEGELRNGPELPEASGGEFPFRNLTAKHGRVQVDFEPLVTVVIEDVDLSLEHRSGRLEAALECTRGFVEHPRGITGLESFIAKASLKPDRGVYIEHLAVQAPTMRVEINDGFVPIPFSPDYEGSVSLVGSVPAIVEALPIAIELPALEGDTELSAHVIGSSRGPSARGVFILKHGSIDTYRLGTLRLPFTLDPERLRVRGGRARLIRSGGNLGIDATLGLSKALPLETKLTLENVQFAKLMEQLGVTPNAIVSWEVDGRAHLGGTISPLSLRGPTFLRTRNFRVSRDAWHVTPVKTVLAVDTATLSAETQLTSDALSFRAVTARTRRSKLQGNVRLGFDNIIAVDVRSDSLDLRDASPLVDFPLAGVGTASLDVTGTFQDPEVQGNFAFEDFEFNEFRFGGVVSDARLEKDGYAVRFPMMKATKRSSAYRAKDLMLDFSAGDGRLVATGTLEAETLALADVYHAFRYNGDERFEPYQGGVSGKTTLHYTYGFPTDSPTGTLKADLDLDLHNLNIQGFAFREGKFRGHWLWRDQRLGYKGGELEVEELTLKKGLGTVFASGRMHLGGGLHFTVNADRLAIQETEGIGARLPSLSGIYAIAGEVRGSAAIPRAHLDVQVAALHWAGRALGDGRVYVRLTDAEDPWIKEATAWNPSAPPEDAPCARARVGFAQSTWPKDPPLRTNEGPVPALERPMAYVICGSGLDDHVQIDLAVGRTAVYPLRGSVGWSDLPLNAWLPEAAAKHVAASSSGSLQLSGGAMLQPETLEGTLVLEDLHAGQGNLAVRNQGPVRLAISPGHIRIEQATFSAPGTHFVLSGNHSLKKGLDLDVQGRADLSVLASLVPRVQSASGQLALALELTGPLSDPQVGGTVEVDSSGMRLADVPVPIDRMSGQVRFDHGDVLVDTFVAEVAGGTVRVGGRAQLKDRRLEQYELNLLAEDLAFVPESGVEAKVGGALGLRWQRPDRLPLLDGEVRLEQLTYKKNFDLSQKLAELSERGRADVTAYDPDKDRLLIDLRLVQDTPAQIRNNLVETAIVVDDSQRPFRILGTDQRFGVLGRLVFRHGILRFRNNDFTIRRGTIEFDDPTRVAPRLDLLATTEIRRPVELGSGNWRIALRAVGRPEALELETRSEPELTQEDIILLLTLGITRSEAEQLQAGEITGAAAFEAISAVTGVGREVRQAIGIIDEFSVSSAYNQRQIQGQTQATTDPQVTVGKRIADRVRVRASTGLSEQRNFRAGVEWRLGDNTSVEGVYDNINATTASSIGNLGVDLRWRLEFE